MADSKRERIRSESYYFKIVILDVEGRLYTLPKESLISQSPVFEGMFAVGNGSGEGDSDDKPIVLEGYQSKDFECLLRVMLPKPFERSIPSLKKEEWLSVLKLSTIWQIDVAPKLAVEQLSGLGLTPIEKIKHAREFRVAKWLTEGVTTLVREWAQHNVRDIATILGWETTALILSARDQTRHKEADYLKLEDWVCWRCNRTPTLDPPGSEYGLLCSGQGCFAMNRRQPQGSATKTPPELVGSHAIISELFGDEIKDLEG